MDDFSPLCLTLIISAILFIVLLIAGIVGGVRLRDAIENATTVAERINIKKSLQKKRKLWRWALVIIVIIPIVILFSYPVLLTGSIISITVVAIMILSLLSLQTIFKGLPEEFRLMAGNISIKTADDVLNGNEQYALFLRGFDSDLEYERGIAPITTFSEEYLARVVRRGLGVPLYAVGKPNEVDTPHGAQRVYIDNEDWQDKVMKLIQKANRVFVLVSDSDSCLWELQCCEKFKDKCAFIITDRKKFLTASSRLSGKVSFLNADRSDSIEDNMSYYYYGNLPVKSFEGAYLAYNDIANVNPPISLADDPPKKAPKYLITILIVISLLSIILLSTMDL